MYPHGPLENNGLLLVDCGHQPFEQNSSSKGASELRRDELGHVGGRMPANELLAERASVTAGLAKDVDAVNPYAAVI